MIQHHNSDVVLIFPPVAKPAEPPAGIAQIKRAIETAGRRCTVIDSNLEGLLFLLHGTALSSPPPSLQTAWRNKEHNLSRLRDLKTFQHPYRYRSIVFELNRVLASLARSHSATISLTDYQHESLAPVRLDDLYYAVEHPHENPFYSYFETTLKPRIETAQPAIIGLSLTYLSQALTTCAMIGWLRQTFPGVRLLLGGGLTTSWLCRPDGEKLLHGLADRLVKGAGEKIMLQELGCNSERETSFRPDYSDLNLSNYLSPTVIFPYSTSSGCYWRRCEFCPESAEGHSYRPIAADQVLAELDTNDAEKPGLIHFLDNALSPALLHKFTQHILPAPWYGYARFTTELNDPDFCSALSRSGCVMLQLGLESGDQGVLDGMKKGINLESVSRALRNLKDAGIAAFVYLLFGTPWETETEAEHTIRFVVDHNDCIQFLNAAIFNLPLFSDEANRHQTQSFYDGDLALYVDFHHPRGWNRSRVRRFLQNEFNTHPMIKKILKNNPPSFTSNHAPFFLSHFQSQGQ